MTENIFNLLENNSYPGRGILIGKSEDGTKNYIVYFIMGRSENKDSCFCFRWRNKSSGSH